MCVVEEGKMYKTIIVDDEQYSYEYLAECIRDMSEDFEVVGIFRNGADAWEFINEEKVDVVITDIKMPVMSGLDLIKLIYENGMNISVIIISGYEDFEYARQAIKYNVFYYLLKAIDLDEFFDVLKRLKEQLDKSNTKSFTEEFESEMEKFFARGLADDFENYEEMKNEYAKLGLKLDFEKVLCCIYEINIEQYNMLLSEDWKYGKDSFEKAITYVIESIFDETSENVFIFSISNSTIQCIILKDNYMDCSNYVTENIKKLLDIDVSVQCKGAPVNIKEMKNLCDLIDDDILKKLRASYSGFCDASQVSDKKALSEFAEENKDETKDLLGITAEEAIFAAKEYMDRNFSKDISRYDITACTHFAPKYFGKLFKRKTGKTIADYLMELRLKKAIELLESDLKIQDIANAVGIINQRSFQRAFKNFTGYSAAEYRKIIIKNKGFK